jgi:hypothetical protein
MHSTHADSHIEPTFCRAPEAAKAIPLPLRTFHLRVAQGLIPSYKLGCDRFFKKAEVIAAIEKYRIGTKHEALNYVSDDESPPERRPRPSQDIDTLEIMFIILGGRSLGRESRR